jgi:hypothetical protein
MNQKLLGFTGMPEEVNLFRKTLQKKNYGRRIGYKYIEDLPEHLEYNLIYIVGEKNYSWMVALKCPCGCRAIVQLNLLKGVFPSWRLSFKRGLITIKPSILRIVGCRSHFIITKGRIITIN